MRICLLGYAAALPGNGVASYASNLAGALAERGHDVQVITQPLGRTVSTGNWRFIQVGPSDLGTSGAARFAAAILTHFRQLKSGEHPDIVHSFSASPFLALLAGLASRIAHIPSVHTALSDSGYDWCFRLNDVLAYSFLGNGPAHPNAFAVPPPIKQDVFRLALSRRESSTELRIGYLGPLLARKGARVFVQSLPSVISAFPSVEVTLAISATQALVDPFQETEARWIRSFVEEKGLGKNIRFLGDVIPAEVFAELDLLVFPVQSAVGLLDPPMTVIESMTAGCAVLTTRVGSMSSLLKHGQTGYLIEPGRESDPQAYAETIAKLAKRPDLVRQVGLNAASKVEIFSSDRVAGIFEEHYRHLV